MELLSCFFFENKIKQHAVSLVKINKIFYRSDFMSLNGLNVTHWFVEEIERERVESWGPQGLNLSSRNIDGAQESVERSIEIQTKYWYSKHLCIHQEF